MNTFSHRLQVDDIDCGDGDQFAQCILSIWRRYEGNLSSDYIQYFPKMVLFDARAEPGSPPDILETGDQALSTKILGQGWADNKETVRDFLGRKYCEAVGRDYFDAAQQNLPLYSVVHAKMKNTDNLHIDVIYQRLILPVRTLGGAKFLLGYSFLHGKDLPEVDRTLIDETQPHHTPKRPDYSSLFL